GWLSMGFEKEDNRLNNAVFHKFSYPGAYIPQLDPVAYDGNILYYSYGTLSYFSENSIGVAGASGIPGESGSSFFLAEKEKTYTVYGVLNLSYNLVHSRIHDYLYFTFMKAMAPSFPTYVKEAEKLELVVYPNPAQHAFRLKLPDEKKLDEIRVYDLMGRMVLIKRNPVPTQAIEINHLKNGKYLIQVYTEGERFQTSLIKQ